MTRHSQTALKDETIVAIVSFDQPFAKYVHSSLPPLSLVWASPYLSTYWMFVRREEGLDMFDLLDRSGGFASFAGLFRH